MSDRQSAVAPAAMTAADARARRSTVAGGVVLYSVLVVLVMLSLVVISLMFRVRAEVAGSDAGAKGQQAMCSALSGVQRAIAVLSESSDDMELWWDNEELFGSQLVFDDGVTEWYFTVYADNSEDPDNVRYGVMDEAGRININTADAATLLALPNMTEELVDCLMDYRDSDSDARAQGAEQDYYDQLPNPYIIANGPFATLEELLLVKGFTASMVYGEDANHNGLLEPNESDGDESFPPDNGDSELDLGLMQLATALSYDREVDNEGRPRIDLNGSAEALISSGLSPETLEYIAAYRREGGQFVHPVDLLNAEMDGPDGRIASGIGLDELDDVLDRFNAGMSLGMAQIGGLDGMDDPFGGFGSVAPDPEPRGGGDGGGGRGLPDEMLELERNAAGDGAPMGPSNGPDEMADPAENRSGRPRRRAMTGRRTFGGRGGGSEFGADGPPDITVSAVSLTRGGGLVNVNTASVEVLAAVGGMGAAMAQQIVDRRSQLEPEEKETAAWLFTEGLVGEDEFKNIARLLTTRSYQYRVRCVGYGVPGGRYCVIEAVVDFGGSKPRIMYLRQMTRLGAPFALAAEVGLQ